MFQYMNEHHTKRYIDVLPKLVENYNNSVNRDIQMSPKDAQQLKNQNIEWQNLYRHKHIPLHPKYKFRVGDLVLVSLDKTQWGKGYHQQFSDQIYRVYQRIPEIYPFYRLESIESGQKLKAKFYEYEMSLWPTDS